MIKDLFLLFHLYKNQHLKKYINSSKRRRMNSEAQLNQGGKNTQSGRQQSEQPHHGGFLGSQGGFDGLTAQHLQAADEHKVLFLSGKRKVKAPKDENYWDMMKIMCCPTCKWLSFTSLMVLVYLAIFITEAVRGLNKEGTLLEIYSSTLIEMGANYPYGIRSGQVWRLLTAAILHIDFMHFLGNWVSTLILLSRFQYTFGSLRCIIIYIFSSIGGNIFTALCAPDTFKAGASTCLYGLLGVTVGYILLNWSGLNIIGPILKCQLVCISVMLIVFTVVFTSAGGESIDYYGHLGGFISGFFLASINKTITTGKCQKVSRVVGLLLYIILLIVCFVMFYTAKNLNFLIIEY